MTHHRDQEPDGPFEGVALPIAAAVLFGLFATVGYLDWVLG